ncbi:lysophospholipid acyltransferase family protein [Companilactobacillus huachuanensis]|uniref:Lysophospholipid acyltransferase family protein n=1 Tax=Companilactobacillus huachuanensis TaxID=2559914 RepID=A0ABW1RQ17_9LACO|nr:lysophospholipid acyltransferase family protein [Companilactobacillus huachuanensis]
MIIGNSKVAVRENIKQAIIDRDFNRKVEIEDPIFSRDESERIIRKYLKDLDSPYYRINNLLSRGISNFMTLIINRHTEIIGIENLRGIDTGAIITSNHFNPLENTAIRTMTKKSGHKRLFIVSEDTNLSMKGIIGFLMNYYDTVPISGNLNYMGHTFPKMIQKILKRKEWILIYPEQEMWFNYRKPRPVKRGAYYYAAKFNVPIISCFVEIVNTGKKDNNEFDKTNYIVHVLKPIYPKSGNVRDSSRKMMAQDYQQKKAAFEAAYSEKLNYDFEAKDIVGWRK